MNGNPGYSFGYFYSTKQIPEDAKACFLKVRDENSVRDADIFPSSTEIKRGSPLQRFCILGKRHTPHRNASHIIWKLNDKLIPPENYNIVNETVSSITINNFTYNTAYLKCFMKYLDKEQLLVHTEVKSGFPPDTPRNISCIYYFDNNLTCTWNSGRETSFARKFTLYRKLNTHPNSTVSSCQSKTESCSFLYPDTPYSSSFCFQVKAENVLGEALSKCVPIAMEKIEKFEAPEILSVKKISGIKQLLTVTWKMPEKIIPSRDLTCQLQYRNLYSNSTEFATVPMNSVEKTGSCNLTGLWDATEYSVAIRCISNESIFWSEWSGEKTGSTVEKAAQIIETVTIFTTNKDLVVEWIASKPGATEYVVEWYEDLETDPFRRSWQYVSNSTNWKTNKEPSEGPVVDTDIPGKNEVTIKWKKISKDKRNGFITNYTIFYKPEDGKQLNETVNSNVLEYRLKSLQANTQYTVYIMASNKAGGTSGEPKTFKTLKLDGEDVFLIAVLVGISMFCLLGLWITCVLKQHVFKKVCWPDIPNPAESIAVEWPLGAPMNNSLLKRLTSEAKTLGFEDINVLEHCFPEESQEGSLLMNCENHVPECINTKDMISGDKKILHKEENEGAKCFSASMPYVMTDQFNRSQVKSAFIPVKEIQPIEMLANNLCGSQQNSVKNEENDDEVLNLEDFSEKTLFNPYLKNSVKTREFLTSESLSEHRMDECKSQSSVLPPFQQNVGGQSYITLDMFGLATAQ
ncbi:hypothetical protein WISP_34481 [Willisornis vidua]|uniref:Fibronectin type-III domain-containing protein n=1 Tax=Willisornis vidua TaxID=1566151 RepID=A0ABQ9DQ97_9PASS|nr:hypothetical protein WISP_34481 [Willisornis vidua]